MEAEEGGIARRAPDQGRIVRRAAKLLQREIAHAAFKGWDKMRCPCTIHVREQRLSLSINSYRRCLSRNGRHPWFFGSSEVLYLPGLCISITFGIVMLHIINKVKHIVMIIDLICIDKESARIHVCNDEPI